MVRAIEDQFIGLQQRQGERQLLDTKLQERFEDIDPQSPEWIQKKQRLELNLGLEQGKDLRKEVKMNLARLKLNDSGVDEDGELIKQVARNKSNDDINSSPESNKNGTKKKKLLGSRKDQMEFHEILKERFNKASKAPTVSRSEPNSGRFNSHKKGLNQHEGNKDGHHMGGEPKVLLRHSASPDFLRKGASIEHKRQNSKNGEDTWPVFVLSKHHIYSSGSIASLNSNSIHSLSTYSSNSSSASSNSLTPDMVERKSSMGIAAGQQNNISQAGNQSYASSINSIRSFSAGLPSMNSSSSAFLSMNSSAFSSMNSAFGSMEENFANNKHNSNSINNKVTMQHQNNIGSNRKITKKNSGKNGKKDDGTNVMNSTDQSIIQRKIFVGKIQKHTTKKVLVDFFGEFGEIEDVDVNEDRGCCFILFKDKSTVEKILCSSNQHLRYFTISQEGFKHYEICVRRYVVIEKDKLFVRGLDSMVTKEDLFQYFRQYGRVISITLHNNNKHNNNTNNKPYAFIKFARNKSVNKIMARNDHAILGKPVHCLRAHSQSMQN